MNHYRKGMSDICESMHYGVITRVTFDRSKDSDYEDIVCISYTYWDSEEEELYESSILFDHIYTSGKNRFQQFCREFEAINDIEFDLEKVVGLMCMTEYHLDIGKLMRVPNRSELDAYKNINKNFRSVSICKPIENMPDMISNYWFSEKVDHDSVLTTDYYGVIRGVVEKKSKDSEDEKEHILKVEVYADGKSSMYHFYTNGERTYKYTYLCDLCDGIVTKEALDSLVN